MKHIKYIRGPLFLLKMVLILAIMGAVFMLLWNALIPAIFNGPVLTYWQAVGLLLLSKLLFGTIGRGFGRKHHHYPDELWKRKLKAKYEAMSPEDQDKFRNKCKSRFSYMDFDCADKAESKENENKTN